MKTKITKKDFLDKASVHTYGKVGYTGGSGKQFCIGWEPQFEGEIFLGFKYLIFAYGKKTIVLNKIFTMLNECSDGEVKELNWVDCSVKKIPIMLKGGIGLNCF